MGVYKVFFNESIKIRACSDFTTLSELLLLYSLEMGF